MTVVERSVQRLLTEFRSVFRVIVVNGPRQAGKSTLLTELHRTLGGSLATLDDREVLRAARTDPRGFVTGLDRPLFIDEIQRGGDPLVLAIKAEVDRNPSQLGSFILAGSSRFLTVPTLSESLAGRAGIVELWPFSQGELLGEAPERFVDLAFGPTASLRQVAAEPIDRRTMAERVVRGGFPSVATMERARARAAWFDAYLETLVGRDLSEYRQPRRTLDIGRLTRLLLGRTAQEVNPAALASALQITAETVRDYVALTETVFLHHQLPAWTSGQTGRAIRRPKLHAVDTGLAAHVLNTSAEALTLPTATTMGPLLETFVVNEITKQNGWSDIGARLFHYRDSSGREVDLILEARGGPIVGIEVKAAHDVDETDFRHLKVLRDRLGERFVNGIVLHLGERPLPFGERLTALPIGALWGPL